MAVSELEQSQEIHPLGKRPTTIFLEGSPLYGALAAFNRAVERNGSSQLEEAPRAVTVDGLPGFRRKQPQKRIVIDGDDMIM